jgi:hypothetical protein
MSCRLLIADELIKVIVVALTCGDDWNTEVVWYRYGETSERCSALKSVL